MNETVFFFDTYAFFEIIRGNEKYRAYKKATPITTIFNLAEFNYALKREAGEVIADNYTELYEKFVVPILVEDIKKAMTLRLHNKKLSIPDAIGYTVAKRHGVRFLTCDQEFKNMPNTEFVRK